MLLPLVYLVLRTVDAGPAVLALLTRPRTAQLLVNTVGLAVTVTLAATALAVPLAWLITRTVNEC